MLKSNSGLLPPQTLLNSSIAQVSLLNYLLLRKDEPKPGWTAAEFPMREKSQQTAPDSDPDAAVAEFIRTRGVTRCPTACVLPTHGSVTVADREALEEHVLRQAERRRAKSATRAQQFWNIELLRPALR
jgi:hypothetical protein